MTFLSVPIKSLAQAGPTTYFHPKYRPDIDGMRAIAVLLVVSYHAFPRFVAGGFIGVDIFFVISGFLISSIIFKGCETRQFSFRTFYGRRIKRIFPALLLVLVVSYTFGWLALFADEFKQLGKHIAGGAGFVSNFVLWRESGYFDNAAVTKPLLHLWSLGIEEQFYIFWPLFVWVAFRRQSKLFIVLISFLACFSILLNIGFIGYDVVATFYSPATRFWELLAGSVLAYTVLRTTDPVWRMPVGRWPLFVGQENSESFVIGDSALRNISSALGFAGIVSAALLITERSAFPGFWAMLPVAGAVLLIAAGPNTWLNRNVLANRLLVWFGLISYPLYLWHWPLLTFASIVDDRAATLSSIRITAVIISITLAWITYEFVERPVRFGKRDARKTIVLVILMVLVGSAGFYTYSRNGFHFRVAVHGSGFDFKDLKYAAHFDGWHKCSANATLKPVVEGCNILYPNKPIDIVVIGDSHAGHLGSGLAHVFKRRSENVAMFYHAGCYPLYPQSYQGVAYFDCPGNLIENAFEQTINTPSIKTVVLSGYANARIFENRYHQKLTVNSEVLKKRIIVFRSGLHETLTRLTRAGKNVIFLIDVPEMFNSPLRCIARPYFRFNMTDYCTIPKREYLERNEIYREILNDTKNQFPSVRFFDSSKILCDNSKCYGKKGDILLYATHDHLTLSGSKLLMEKAAPIIIDSLLH
jgi:peptidoglycan/LPS O-acetylase OafA/YrhL